MEGYTTEQELPLDRLSPRDFERLTYWLVRREGYERVEFLGQAGSEQGRDVVAWKGGRRVVFQCKRVRRFVLAGAVDELAKLEKLGEGERPDVMVFVVSIAVSADLRAKIRGFWWGADEDCRFWSGAELDERIKRHPEVVKQFFRLLLGESSFWNVPNRNPYFTGHGRPQLEVPDILPYLSDRNTQRDDLSVAIEEHRKSRPRRPLVVVAYGDEREEDVRFFDRLEQKMLPELLGVDKVEQESVPWEEADGSLQERSDRLQRSLSDELLGHRGGSVADILGAIESYPVPVMVTTFVSAREWLPHEPELVRAWLDLWCEIGDLSEELRLIPCLSLRLAGTGDVAEHEAGGWATQWLRRRRDRRRLEALEQANRSIEALLESADGPCPLAHETSQGERVSVVVLTRLRGLTQVDLERWIEKDVREFCERAPFQVSTTAVLQKLKEWVHKRFLEWQRKRIPTRELAEAVRGQLARYVNETGASR